MPYSSRVLDREATFEPCRSDEAHCGRTPDSAIVDKSGPPGSYTDCAANVSQDLDARQPSGSKGVTIVQGDK